MRRQRLIAAVLGLVFLASCGGHEPAEQAAPADIPSLPRDVALPTPVPAVPAFRAHFQAPVDPALLVRLGGIKGVRVVAPVRMTEVRVGSPRGPRLVRIAALDALEYRSVAPAATREAGFVWKALLAGEAVVSFDAARKLGLESGGELRLPGYGPISVGAVADTAVPDFADVVVDLAVGQSIGVGPARQVVIGAALGSDPTALRTRLRQVPGIALRALVPTVPAGAEPEPMGTAEGDLIGSMRYRILKSGFIEPDPAWVTANIGVGTVPILGEVICHRLVFPQLGAALAEVEDDGLAHLIVRKQYGGCYVPRFIARDPARALSMHAFGLALDINVAQNLYGTRGNMDPRIVAIFERWGFEWGGRWSPPDPMHFELTRLVEP